MESRIGHWLSALLLTLLLGRVAAGDATTPSLWDRPRDTGKSGRAEEPRDPDFERTTRGKAPAREPAKTPIHRGLETETEPAKVESSSSALWKTLLATVACGGGLMGAVRFFSRWNPLARGPLPDQVLEVVGNKQLTGQFTLHLVRVGQRILVLGTSAESVCPLGEVDDPDEVRYLMGLCQPEGGSNDPPPLWSRLMNRPQTANRASQPVRTRTAPTRPVGTEKSGSENHAESVAAERGLS